IKHSMLRRTPRILLLFTVVIAMAYSTLSCTTLPANSAHEQSPQFARGKFRNAAPRQAPGFAKTLGIPWRFMTDTPADAVPARPLQVLPLTQSDLAAAPDMSLWRLGHSTLLLKLNGQFWLTDPVFSERASPFSFMGPKRFHAPPIAIDDLPP